MCIEGSKWTILERKMTVWQKYIFCMLKVLRKQSAEAFMTIRVNQNHLERMTTLNTQKSVPMHVWQVYVCTFHVDFIEINDFYLTPLLFGSETKTTWYKKCPICVFTLAKVTGRDSRKFLNHSIKPSVRTILLAIDGFGGDTVTEKNRWFFNFSCRIPEAGNSTVQNTDYMHNDN